MSPFGATVIAVGLNLLQLQARFFGERQLQDDVAGPGVELDPFGIVVAGPVDELAVRFLADLHVVDVGILIAQEAADHLAVGREDEDPGMGTRVDIARPCRPRRCRGTARSRISRRARGPSPAPCQTSSGRTPSAPAEACPPHEWATRVRKRATKAMDVERFITKMTPHHVDFEIGVHFRVRAASRPKTSPIAWDGARLLAHGETTSPDRR